MLAHRSSRIVAYVQTQKIKDFLLTTASRYTLNFYRNNGAIGIYPKSNRVGQVVDPNSFDFDDNIKELGYNNKISFISQFQLLFQWVKLPVFHHFSGVENCGFSNHVSNTINSYLSFHITGDCENVLYSFSVKLSSVNIYNSVMIWVNCTNVYQCLGVIKSSNIFYSRYIISSSQIWGSHNLVNCEECIYCNHLEHKKYCIRNIQYSPEEYEIQKQSIFTDMSKIEDYYWLMTIQGINYASIDCEGSFITDSIDTQGSRSHFVKHGTNVLFSGHTDGLTHAYGAILTSGGSKYYNSCAIGGDSERVYCSFGLRKCFDIYYSYYLESCSFCLGCIGLKNKSYCILNKQYTKEERYEKVDEIFGQMEKDGTLGEFFPASMNPFYFNDTAAYLIDPSFTKEEVTVRGYLRRDEPIKVDIPEGAKVVKTSELVRFEGWRSVDVSPQQWYIDPEILKYIIQDEQGNVYRIVKIEYDFLMKHGLPLPRKHWLDRMKENFRIH